MTAAPTAPSWPPVWNMAMHSFFWLGAVAGGILSFVVAAHAADHKYAPEVDWWSPPRCVHAARVRNS